MLISARCGDGLRYQETMMEKTENKPIVIGADAAPFKFELPLPGGSTIGRSDDVLAAFRPLIK
ncbi:hypothetical protein CRH02_14260 [Escherichia albertii]|nr:hypothetical protein CRH02_14260 [Escherichia albertii]